MAHVCGLTRDRTLTEHAVSTWHSAAFILCLLSHQQSTRNPHQQTCGPAPALWPQMYIVSASICDSTMPT